MNCDLIYVEPRGAKHLLRCEACGAEVVSSSRSPKMNCIAAGDAPPPFPKEVMKAAALRAEERGVLLGDLIAEMTRAVGIPTCGGCEKRRQWLNRVHAWLRGD